MKSENILLKNGYLPANLDVCFEPDIVGSCSVNSGKNGLYKAVCITIKDNGINTENMDECILPIETLKEIALSCDILYTDFGFNVHSHTMKSDNILKHLKINRINN